MCTDEVPTAGGTAPEEVVEGEEEVVVVAANPSVCFQGGGFSAAPGWDFLLVVVVFIIMVGCCCCFIFFMFRVGFDVVVVFDSGTLCSVVLVTSPPAVLGLVPPRTAEVGRSILRAPLTLRVRGEAKAD